MSSRLTLQMAPSAIDAARSIRKGGSPTKIGVSGPTGTLMSIHGDWLERSFMATSFLR